MKHSTQIIQIIPGWNHLFYADGSITIPNEEMLLELIRPGFDPNSATIQWLKESETTEIPDKDSQLILKQWSNDTIIRMCTHSVTIDNPQGIDELSSLIMKACIKKDVDCREPLYYLGVKRYIDYLFPEKLLPNRQKMLDLFSQLDIKFQSDDWDDLAELAQSSELEESDLAELAQSSELEESESVSPKSLLGKRYTHSSRLEQRFPDYKLANDYLDMFYLFAFEGKDALALLRALRNRAYDFKKTSTIPICRQCPQCEEWFKNDKFGSGQIKSSTCGKDACKTAYENSRKPKKRSGKGWEKGDGFNKKKRCRKCRYQRIVNNDRLCNLCFEENIVDAETQSG